MAGLVRVLHKGDDGFANRLCVYGATSFSLLGAPSVNRSLVDPPITI